MFLNLTECSQEKWIESNPVTVRKVIPNSTFIKANVIECRRLHNVIKDYVDAENEYCKGHTVKAFRFVLQKEINSYYVYANKWVSVEYYDNCKAGY